MKRQSLRAFTLIELLIVVAIISILAAIAVPNFLEAQVRAKVSRAKSDMRSFTTALEMYRTDANAYPENMNQVTTPVAFVTQKPDDVFTGDGSSRWLGYINVGPMTDPANLQVWNVNVSTQPQRDYLSSMQWFLWSNGPDIKNDALLASQEAFNDVVKAPGHTLGYFYDPTNGSVSRGDIVRSPVVTN